MSFTFLTQLILAVGLATSAAAQYTPGGYGPPGGQEPGRGGTPPPGGGGRMGRPGGGMGDMPTPTKIEGPATPAIMSDTVRLSTEQLERYAVRYANHMAATRSVRDSLRNSMAARGGELEGGDRSAARGRRSELQRQWKDLSKRDKDFENSLKDVLSKDQQKRYKKWKEAREKAERELWEDRRPSRRGAGQGW